MIYSNYHSHSKYCDGSGNLEDYVDEALRQKFTSFGFSSHAPLPFTNDWTMAAGDLGKYLKEAKSLKVKYSGQLDLYTGLEIDFVENRISPADPVYSTIGLDYRIGSVHVFEDMETGEFPGVEYTEKELRQLLDHNFGGSSKRMVKTYYESLCRMIETGGFDIVGHLDIIKKLNNDNKYFNEEEKWYRDNVMASLELIRDSDIIMEVNTRGNTSKSLISFYPSPWVLKIAGNMGIPLVINSDAHRPENISAHFPEAVKLIMEIGYREVMVLHDGIWEKEALYLG